MQINFFERLMGSGFYTGYLPFASGTFASIAAILIYWIPGFENLLIMSLFIVLFCSYGVYVGNKFEKIYGKDPAECTIDEIVGQWIALLFMPKMVLTTLLSFFVWRFLDIIKPFPAKKLEGLPGGVGIMIDDIVAAVYSLIIVHIILFIFKIV